MRPLINPVEFVSLYSGDTQFQKALDSSNPNFRMREFLNSYNFVGTRKNADTVINVHTEGAA